MHVPSGWKRTELTTPSWSENVWTNDLDVTSQRRTVRSSLPDTISRASGANWAVRTQLECALIEYWNLRSSTVYTFSVLSSEPVSNNAPSHEKLTVLTGAEWALITWDLPSTELCQRRTVESLEAEAIKVPEGWTEISLTASLWPMNLKGLSWALKFHTVTVPSKLP